MQVEEQASRAIYIRLRYRARVLRGLAVGFVVLIVLTLAFGTIPYFLAGDIALSESRSALAIQRAAAGDSKFVAKRDKGAEETAGAGDSPAADAPAATPAPAQPRPAAEPARAASVIGDEAFAAAVIRITAVVLMLGLVLVFGGLFRYSMRLAAYYDQKADSLRLIQGGRAGARGASRADHGAGRSG